MKQQDIPFQMTFPLYAGERTVSIGQYFNYKQERVVITRISNVKVDPSGIKVTGMCRGVKKRD